MKNPNCLFCKMSTGEILSRIVWQDDDVFVLLNLYPSDKGHVMFIPQNHTKQLDEQSSEDAVALMRAVHELAPKIVDALGASGYNIGVNSGEDAGQEIFHTHIHFIPRYEGKKREFGKTEVAKEELDEIADLLKKALN